jgi:phosphopantetheinyl transferase (holo-ACP synthase)
MKALGDGWRGGIAWRDLKSPTCSGRPTLRFYGKAAEIAEKPGVRSIALPRYRRAGAGDVVILES